MSTRNSPEGDSLDLNDYISAYRLAFDPRLGKNRSELERCTGFFEMVTSTRAVLTSHTNSNISGQFQRDIAGINRLETVEDVQNILQTWVKKFTDIATTENAAGESTNDEDGMSVDEDEPDALDPDMVLNIAGVKRSHEASSEDTQWIEEAKIRRTRNQTAEEEAAAQPTHHVQASHVVNSAAFQKLKTDVKKELKRLVDEEDDYWDAFQPDPALWCDTDPAVKEHVAALKIPAVPLHTKSLPDMMLHRLGKLGDSSPGVPALDPRMEERLKPLLNSADWDFFLKNAAGVGKTRYMFELLARRWGLYFNFAHDPTKNPYGSRDMMTVVSQLNHGRRNIHATSIYFQPEVDGYGRASRVARQNNSVIAGHLYLLLVYARALVFEWFLDVYKLKRGTLDDKAIRLWCLLQIRPLLRGKERTQARFDVFDTVFRSVLMVEKESCSKAVTDLLTSCDRKGAKISFLLLDEAHVPAAMFPTAFDPYSRSSQVARKTRPLLKPAMLALREHFVDYSARVLVAATEFNTAIINEAVGSSIMKNFGVHPRPFIDFGDYSQPSEIRNALCHFFGEKYVSGISKIMRSDIDFWLAGRHRFLSTFIQWVLHQGTTRDAVLEVLRQLVYCATGRAYAGIYKHIEGFAFANLVPEQLRKQKIPVELLDIRGQLQHAVIYFIVKGRFPRFSAKRRMMVTLGLGCFVPPETPGGEETIVIKESLVLTSAMVWLNGVEEKPLINVLDKAMSSDEDSARGYAFEDVVQYMLWEAFTTTNGAPLGSVFDFRFLPPAWKNESAQLIQIFKRTSPNGRTYPLTADKTARMGYKAKTAEATRSWFCDSEPRRARIPFLQPDHYCGPDLIFGLLLKDGVEVLVCVQCKCWSKKHYKGDVKKAVLKMTPDGFYQSKKMTESHEANRVALVEQLKQFEISPAKPMPTIDGSHTKKPEITMIRVLAAFDATVAWPTFDSTYGNYPVAGLCDSFMKSATLKFSALEKAYESALQNPTAEVV